MATLNLSDVIKLIPDSKLNWSSDCIDDAEFTVGKLLADPLEFPTLDQAILSEDVICIPVEPGIPALEQIVRQTVVELCEIGIESGNITILLAEGTRQSVVDAMVGELEEYKMEDCTVMVHDSTSKESIGFLGPSQAGDPITLNARLVHADFVLPIARYQTGGWKSQADFLYPYFSDVESQRRFFKLNERHRIALNEEVNKWLGACFRLVCSLRSAESLDQDELYGEVIAGEPNAVQKELNNRTSAKQPLDNDVDPFDLVIAQVRSHTCLTVEEIKKSLDDLIERCSQDATVVMLLDDQIEIPRLLDSSTVGFENEFDSISIFLVTDQKKLNGLGLGRIHDAAEVQRLVDQHQRILVVSDFINEQHLHSGMQAKSL